jgi:hypothetical protein
MLDASEENGWCSCIMFLYYEVRFGVLAYSLCIAWEGFFSINKVFGIGTAMGIMDGWMENTSWG